MGAPVRVEDEAFSDPRIAMLGQIAGYNAFEALGRMTHLWRVCTHKQTYYATEVTVKACLGPNGVEALIGSELGEIENGIIRVRGTEGRIEWLGKRRRASTAGGEATKAKSNAAKSPNTEAKPRKSKAKAEPNDSQVTAKPGPSDSQTEAKPGPNEGHTGAKPEPNRGPLTLTLTPSTSQTTEGSSASPVPSVTDSDQSEPDPDTPIVQSGKPQSPYQQVCAAYQRHYMAANNGTKPLFGNNGKATRLPRQIKDLLALTNNDADEICRRMAVLFETKPRWLDPPFTFATLSSNYDQLVAATSPQQPANRREIDRPGRPLETLL